MSSREPVDMECSADGLLRGGGKGEISVLVSWASVSRRRRRLRLLLGVLRERRDSAFFMAGLSFWGSAGKIIRIRISLCVCVCVCVRVY